MNMTSFFRWFVTFGLMVWVLLGMGIISPVWAGSPVIITSGGSAKHAVALTFDDGPSPRYTPQILALLKQYQARGTFFVLGCKVEQHPGLIKEMLAAGHEVGNHSYSHPRILKTDHLARARELERTRWLWTCWAARKIADLCAPRTANMTSGWSRTWVIPTGK